MTTTTDLLTFFQPGKTAGTTWAFSCPSAHTPREAWTYLPGEADLSRFATREISSEEQFNQLLAEIRAAIQERGGLLAEARVHNEIIKVSLEGKEEIGYAGPRKMLRLRASGDPRLEAIPQSVDLMAGDHLILPVSAAAQQRLEAFDEVFEGFPEDVRSTILNVLRRPSLEWRINRIEQILSQPPATQAEWEKSRQRSRGNETFLERLSRWFKRKIPVGAAAGAVAVTLLLAFGAPAGYRLLFGDAPEAEEAREAAEEAGGGAEAATAPAGTPSGNTNPVEPPSENSEGNSPAVSPEAETELKDPLGDLFEALKDSENAAFQTLYVSHFKSSRQEFGNGSPVVWGIAKLLALQKGLLQDTDSTLGDVRREARVKEVYRGENAKSFLKDNDSAAKLLAWGFCRRYGKAEMPETKVAPQDTLPLTTTPGCGELEPQDALAGLEDLTDWVKEQKK